MCLDVYRLVDYLYITLTVVEISGNVLEVRDAIVQLEDGLPLWFAWMALFWLYFLWVVLSF